MAAPKDALSIDSASGPRDDDLAGESFPLSSAQHGIWVRQQLAPDVPFYIAVYVDLRGDLDVDLFRGAAIDAGHEFETGFLRLTQIDGEPYQVVDRSLEATIEVIDFRGEAMPVDAAHAWMGSDCAHAIDPMRERLLRTAILQIGTEHYLWYFRIHHVALDGFGLMTMMNRIAALYTAALSDRRREPHHAAALRTLYELDRSYHSSNRFASDLEYWADRLDGPAQIATLAETAAPPGVSNTVITAPLQADVAARLDDSGNRTSGTSAAALIAGFACYLSRMTGQASVRVRTPLTARPTAVLRRSAGMTANIVPLQIEIREHDTVGDLTGRVHRELTGALRHQRGNIHEILRTAGIGPGERGGPSPVVNVLLFPREIVLGSVTGEFHVLTTGPVEDVSVNIYRSGTPPETFVGFEGNPNLYPGGVLASHHRAFVEMIEEFVTAHPDTALDSIHRASALEGAIRRDAASSLDFWRRRLTPVPQLLELSWSRRRPAHPSSSSDRLVRILDAGLHGRLRMIAGNHDTTVFTTVYAAVTAVLARISGSDDIAIVTPVEVHRRTGSDGRTGRHVNAVVLRTAVNSAWSFAELLTRVRADNCAAFAHAQAPFEQVLGAVDPAWSLSPSPLLQVGLGIEDPDRTQSGVPGVTVLPAADSPPRPGALHWTVAETFDEAGTPAGMSVTLTYCVDRIDPASALALMDRFVRMLGSVVADPSAPLGDVPLVDRDEQRTMLRSWNETSSPDTPTLLLDEFAAQVRRTPDAPAVIFGDEAVTFTEFDARVNRLAHYLISRGVGPDCLVGVCMSRSIEMMIGIYAVLQAGGGYLPMDPEHPIGRNTYMLEIAAPLLVLTTASDRASLPTEVVSCVDIDALDLSGCETTPLSDRHRLAPLRPENLAYVLFTSGSTGLPKAVAVTHRSIANQLAWLRERYVLDGHDAVLQKTPITFDASVWELFLPLQVGARLVLARPVGHRDPAYLMTVSGQQQVTVLQLVPSVLAVLLADSSIELPESLRYVAVGGEALSTELAARFGARSDAVLDNLYGPTEVTVNSTAFRCEDVVPDPVPIGRPVRNTRAVVLDRRLRPVPVGVSGELYLGGVQVARGYHARADLTAERFVADPFGNPGARLYRTGDRVRRLPGSRLEYLGRTDFQVKIGGVRIELGEIDSTLSAHPAVGFAVTSTRSGPAGNTVLVSYVFPADGAALDVAELNAHVRGLLPTSMVPATIVVLDEIPLMSSGKVDRAALPEPDRADGAAAGTVNTPTEKAVAEVISTVLGVDCVGVGTNFFAAGGNSLTATAAVARINATLGTRIGLRELFDSPTVGALAARIDSIGAQESTRPALTVSPRPDHLPLSPAQHRMWLVNQLDPSSPVYNMPIALRLSGCLDTGALHAALADVIARHEPLRTVYPKSANGTRQVLVPVEHVLPLLVPVPVPDESTLRTRLGRMAAAGFDVAGEVPMRVTLFELSPDEHVLTIVVHHIAADGMSMAPLARDVIVAYSARLAGHAPDWRPLAVQYSDYTVWQRRVLGCESDPDSRAGMQLAYWQRTLAGAPASLQLPTDRPRPGQRSMRGETVPFEVDAGVHRRLRTLARTHGSTMFMIMHAALAVVLARTSGTEDITVGTPVGGRGEAALDDVVGMFVNTVALRTQVDPNAGVSDLLDQIRDRDLEAFAHADIPFEQVVEAVDPRRSTAHSPLFQVILEVQQLELPHLTLPGLSVEPVDLEADVARYDLHLRITEEIDTGGDAAPAGISAAFGFAVDIFDRTTVHALAQCFVRVLEAMVSEPTVRVGDIDLLSPIEQQQLAPRTGAPDAAAATLPAMLTAAAANKPDAVAVVCGDRRLTYRQLDVASNTLARLLLDRGVQPQSSVAVALPRSLESVVALWAIAKAGMVFVPVDPTNPAARIEHVLTDSEAAVGVTVAEFAGVLPGTVPWIALDDPAVEAQMSAYSSSVVTAAERGAPVWMAHAAYMIYTSGSTGRPKGVVITHGGLANLVTEQRSRFGSTPAARVLHSASPSFDASLLELLWAFGSGSCVVISPPTVFGGTELADLVEREKVTHMFSTPSALMSVDPARLETVRYLVVGGEPCPPELVERWATDRTMINAYGPSEATIVANAGDALVAGEPVTIGGPIRGFREVVLDARLRPVPVGVTGELYLSGPGLARGYRNQPALTAARFVADPFGKPGQRMYRTGDLVRWRRNHHDEFELGYVGRSDHQVKLRGLRIDLGEIESVVRSVPSIDQAVIVAHHDPKLGDQLVAYVVPHLTAEHDVETAKSAAVLQLPAYMVPSAWVVLDALPLNVSGKLDRTALPPPVFAHHRYRAPSTPVEQVVADTFAHVLGIEQVGADDDFFALGGHSLLVIEVLDRLRELLGTQVSMQELFDHPRVADLARRVESADSAQPAGFAEHAHLADDITAEDVAPAREPAEHVLLTGATGLLGSFLVREVLDQTDAHLWCLVRADSVEHGLKRIEAAMRRFGSWREGDRERLTAVPGDLGDARLGLSADRFAELAEQIDAIVHNGARVNHIETYSRMHAPNVRATEALLRLASTHRLKPLHFVSTTSVLTDTTAPPADQPRIGREDDFSAPDLVMNSGYVQSKWVAESLVRCARDRGLPVSIYRPGLISGDVHSGAGSTDDAFWNMVRAFVALGMIPDSTDRTVSMVPVNYVARALVRIAVDPHTWGGTFHLVTHHRTPITDLEQQLRARGFAMRTVSVPEFGESLFTTATKLSARGDDSLMRAVLVSGEFAAAPADTGSFDDTHTRAVLVGSGIDCPDTDADVLGRYVDYYTRIGFFRALDTEIGGEEHPLLERA